MFRDRPLTPTVTDLLRNILCNIRSLDLSFFLRTCLLHDSFNNEVDLSTVQRVVCKPFLREKSTEKQIVLSQRFGLVWSHSRLILVSMKPRYRRN